MIYYTTRRAQPDVHNPTCSTTSCPLSPPVHTPLSLLIAAIGHHVVRIARVARDMHNATSTTRHPQRNVHYPTCTTRRPQPHLHHYFVPTLTAGAHASLLTHSRYWARRRTYRTCCTRHAQPHIHNLTCTTRRVLYTTTVLYYTILYYILYYAMLYYAMLCYATL